MSKQDSTLKKEIELFYNSDEKQQRDEYEQRNEFVQLMKKIESMSFDEGEVFESSFLQLFSQLKIQQEEDQIKIQEKPQVPQVCLQSNKRKAQNQGQRRKDALEIKQKKQKFVDQQPQRDESKKYNCEEQSITNQNFLQKKCDENTSSQQGKFSQLILAQGQISGKKQQQISNKQQKTQIKEYQEPNQSYRMPGVRNLYVKKYTEDQMSKFIKLISYRLQNPDESDIDINNQLLQFIQVMLLDSVLRQIEDYLSLWNRINYKMVSKALKLIKVAVTFLKTMGQVQRKILLKYYPRLSSFISIVMQSMVIHINSRDQKLKKYWNTIVCDTVYTFLIRAQFFRDYSIYYGPDLAIMKNLLKFIQFGVSSKSQSKEQNQTDKKKEEFTSGIIFTVCYLCQNIEELRKRVFSSKISTKILASQILKKTENHLVKNVIALISKFKKPLQKPFLLAFLSQLFQFNDKCIKNILQWLKNSNERKIIEIQLIKKIKRNSFDCVEQYLASILWKYEREEKQTKLYIWMLVKLITEGVITGDLLLKHTKQLRIKSRLLAPLVGIAKQQSIRDRESRPCQWIYSKVKRTRIIEKKQGKDMKEAQMREDQSKMGEEPQSKQITNKIQNCLKQFFTTMINKDSQKENTNVSKQEVKDVVQVQEQEK